jgi:hypothetical protein
MILITISIPFIIRIPVFPLHISHLRPDTDFNGAGSW